MIVYGGCADAATAGLEGAVSTFHHRISWEWALGALAGILLTKGISLPTALLCLWLMLRAWLVGYAPLLWMLFFMVWSPIRYPTTSVAAAGSVQLEPCTMKGRRIAQRALIFSPNPLRRSTKALLKLAKPMPAGYYQYTLIPKRKSQHMQLSHWKGCSRWRSHWKEWWRETLTRAMGGSPAASLYAAMATGSSSQTTLQQLLQRWGMVHLLAVSGLHVNLLVALLGYALRLCGLAGRQLLHGQLIGISAYLTALGPYPSALRAGLMSVAQLVGRLCGRQISADYALGVACIALLMWAPEWSTHMGFQLSCCATAGLLALTRPLTTLLCWLGCPAWLLGSLSTQLAATLATAPILIATFHSLNITGLVVNMVAAPLLCWGFAISLIIPLLGAQLGQIPGTVLAVATEYLLAAIRLPSLVDQWTPTVFLGVDGCWLMMLALAIACVEVTEPSRIPWYKARLRYACPKITPRTTIGAVTKTVGV